MPKCEKGEEHTSYPPGVFDLNRWIFGRCRKSLTLYLSSQLLVPRSPSLYSPVKALLKVPYPTLLSRSDEALRLLHIEFLLERAVEVG